MFKRLLTFTVLAAGLPLAAQVASALPADRLALANQLSRRGLYAEALKEYEAIRNDASLPRDEVRFRMGEAYRHVNRPKDALAAYDEILKKYPQSRYVDYARLNRALLLDGQARVNELSALNHKGAPLQIRVNALYWLGEAAEKANNAKAAIDWYQKAVELSRTNDVARLANLHRASLLAASNEADDRRRAQAIYLDMAEDKDRELAKEAIFLSGMLSYRMGRYLEAASLFSRLSAQFPNSDRTKESAIFSAWSNFLSKHYSETLKIAVPLRDAGNEDAHYLVASSLRYLERRADAIAAYDAALKAFPNGVHRDSEWFERLSVLASDGNHRAVLAALAERPHPPEKTAARAWSYGCEAAIAVTNFPQAIEYARLVAQRPDEKTAVTAVHRLAWLYEKTGDWARSAQEYRMLAEKWPESKIAPQALYLAGVAETKAGRPEQACADWTKLLAKHPESPYAAEALYSRAMEELRRKEFRLAERSLSELSSRFPERAKRAEALYWWGVAANGSDDAPEAEKHFRAALEAHPTAEFERETKLELASVLQKLGNRQKAAEIFAELISTKAVNRLPPATLEWVAESMNSVTNFAAALAAAKVIEARNLGADWNQIGATLVGTAHEGLDERDAAAAAYERALATGARTSSGATAALALGRIETANGLFDAAKAHLSDAVERTASREELRNVCMQAYVALAANEEERGDANAALGYHMLVGTLFNDPEVVPHALERAAAIMRRQGRSKEAAVLDAERAKRFPKAKPNN